MGARPPVMVAWVLLFVPLLSACPARIGSCNVLDPTDEYNRAIINDPVDMMSSCVVAELLTTGKTLTFDFGVSGDTAVGFDFAPIDGNCQPNVPLSFNPVSARTTSKYFGTAENPVLPIPQKAPIEGWGGDVDNPPVAGDRRLITVDSTRCMLYELSGAYRMTDGFKVSKSAVYNLSRPLGSQSVDSAADASGMPIFPGLLRYEEALTGTISHALRMTTSFVQNAYTYPAMRGGEYNDTSLPPFGARFRLKKTFDAGVYSNVSKIIITALKTYGVILSDFGPTGYLSGVSNDGWFPLLSDMANTFLNIPLDQLEMVQSPFPIVRGFPVNETISCFGKSSQAPFTPNYTAAAQCAPSYPDVQPVCRSPSASPLPEPPTPAPPDPLGGKAGRIGLGVGLGVGVPTLVVCVVVAIYIRKNFKVVAEEEEVAGENPTAPPVRIRRYSISSARGDPMDRSSIINKLGIAPGLPGLPGGPPGRYGFISPGLPGLPGGPAVADRGLGSGTPPGSPSAAVLSAVPGHVKADVSTVGRKRSNSASGGTPLAPILEGVPAAVLGGERPRRATLPSVFSPDEAKSDRRSSRKSSKSTNSAGRSRSRSTSRTRHAGTLDAEKVEKLEKKSDSGPRGAASLVREKERMRYSEPSLPYMGPSPTYRDVVSRRAFPPDSPTPSRGPVQERCESHTAEDTKTEHAMTVQADLRELNAATDEEPMASVAGEDWTSTSSGSDTSDADGMPMARIADRPRKKAPRPPGMRRVSLTSDSSAPPPPMGLSKKMTQSGPVHSRMEASSLFVMSDGALAMQKAKMPTGSEEMAFLRAELEKMRAEMRARDEIVAQQLEEIRRLKTGTPPTPPSPLAATAPAGALPSPTAFARSPLAPIPELNGSASLNSLPLVSRGDAAAAIARPVPIGRRHVSSSSLG